MEDEDHDHKPKNKQKEHHNKTDDQCSDTKTAGNFLKTVDDDIVMRNKNMETYLNQTNFIWGMLLTISALTHLGTYLSNIFDSI